MLPMMLLLAAALAVALCNSQASTDLYAFGAECSVGLFPAGVRYVACAAKTGAGDDLSLVATTRQGRVRSLGGVIRTAKPPGEWFHLVRSGEADAINVTCVDGRDGVGLRAWVLFGAGPGGLGTLKSFRLETCGGALAAW